MLTYFQYYSQDLFHVWKAVRTWQEPEKVTVLTNRLHGNEYSQNLLSELHRNLPDNTIASKWQYQILKWNITQKNTEKSIDFSWKPRVLMRWPGETKWNVKSHLCSKCNTDLRSKFKMSSQCCSCHGVFTRLQRWLIALIVIDLNHGHLKINAPCLLCMC